MARKLSRAAIRKRAAIAKVKESRRELEDQIAEHELPAELIDYLELAELIPWTRGSQAEAARATARRAAGRDRTLELMESFGLVEEDSRHSFVMLSPNTEMKSNEAGQAQHMALVEAVGFTEALKLIEITFRHIPEVTVSVRTRFPDATDAETEEVIPAHTDTIYTFIGTGSVAEMLFWTKVLGNTITVKFDDIYERAKAGKPRERKKS